MFFLFYLALIKPAQQEKALQRVKNSTVIIYSFDIDLFSDEENWMDSISYIGSGSGFFIDDKGTIATNFHVIEEGLLYYMTPADAPDDIYCLDLVDYDREMDLALLALDDDDYTVKNYLELSDRKVKMGDSIYVAGYPRGIDLTLSNGIISNEEHYKSSDDGYYYLVTAAVSPGNSGGPVVDKDGRVIGIATAKYSSAENMNLVRPVKYLEELINCSK